MKISACLCAIFLWMPSTLAQLAQAGYDIFLYKLSCHIPWLFWTTSIRPIIQTHDLGVIFDLDFFPKPSYQTVSISYRFFLHNVSKLWPFLFTPQLKLSPRFLLPHVLLTASFFSPGSVDAVLPFLWPSTTLNQSSFLPACCSDNVNPVCPFLF